MSKNNDLLDILANIAEQLSRDPEAFGLAVISVLTEPSMLDKRDAGLRVQMISKLRPSLGGALSLTRQIVDEWNRQKPDGSYVYGPTSHEVNQVKCGLAYASSKDGSPYPEW